MHANRVPMSWEACLQVHPIVPPHDERGGRVQEGRGLLTPLVTPVGWLSHVVSRGVYFRQWLQSLTVPTPILLDHFVAPKSVFASKLFPLPYTPIHSSCHH